VKWGWVRLWRQMVRRSPSYPWKGVRRYSAVWANRNPVEGKQERKTGPEKLR
jgi:hypothetical protein